jgi:hypothetical protein
LDHNAGLFGWIFERDWGRGKCLIVMGFRKFATFDFPLQVPIVNQVDFILLKLSYKLHTELTVL